jgi:hypothetical protein
VGRESAEKTRNLKETLENNNEIEKDRIEITGLGCAALNVYENCEVGRYL